MLPLRCGLDYNGDVGGESEVTGMAWNRVRWTEARQITAMLDWTAAAEGEPDASLSPQAFFEALVSSGRLVQATQFLGLALPRWDAVAWAARAVRDLRSGAERKPAEVEALKRALLWVQDPTEPRRRAVFEAAEAAPTSSPERLAALAAFFSGGTVTPPDCQPIQAPHDAAGKLAAGAVIAAVFSGPEPLRALENHLNEGVAMAQAGDQR